jgi:hypothetical protein
MRVLSKKQKKLDKNNDGKLSGEDFKMMAYGGKMPEYGGGGRMYANGGGLPGGYDLENEGPNSPTAMLNAMSPGLQDFVRRKALAEQMEGGFYDLMRRHNQFGGRFDNDGGAIPALYGDSMRHIVGQGEAEGMGRGEAKMTMMIDRLLRNAMAGDAYAEDLLNRINNVYDDRIAAGQSEAARQARLSKGSGKPGPYER